LPFDKFIIGDADIGSTTLLTSIAAEETEAPSNPNRIISCNRNTTVSIAPGSVLEDPTKINSLVGKLLLLPA
jgi:signal recognition particle receptor subunit beta